LKKLFTAALALVAAISMGQVDPSRVVATVNGEEIKGNEYYRRMEYLPGVGRNLGRSFAEFPPGLLTLEQLITEKLVMQLAKQKGVLPTDAEVEAEVKIRLADNPQMMEQWAAGGRTPAELRDYLRYELTQFKVQTFGITITDQEIEKHYKDNPQLYTRPKQAKLRMIAVSSEADRNAVDKALSTGTAFGEAAKKYSIDVHKVVGGEMQPIAYVSMATWMREAINATKIGQATSWQEQDRQDGQKAYLKFLLEGVVPEQKVELSPNLRRSIRRRMMLDKGAAKNNISTEMLALRQKAKIDIKQPEFAEAYKKFIDAYLKQGAGG